MISKKFYTVNGEPFVEIKNGENVVRRPVTAEEKATFVAEKSEQSAIPEMGKPEAKKNIKTL